MNKSFITPILILLAMMTILSFRAEGAGNIEFQTGEMTVVDFKTGQPVPIDYYLPVKNLSETARFDISSQAGWIVVFREGNRNLSSVTMVQGNSVNFILEIHPENLNSGVSEGAITVKAVKTDGTVLDSRVFTVRLNKDFVPTPTPEATPEASPTVTPVPSSEMPPVRINIRPSERGFVSLSALGLSEGDVISSVGSGDPDIYIANEWGYRRLFLNPAIFNFYGHLGGFARVRNIAAVTRDTLVVSGYFRNCEINDTRVYGLEVTGEDIGTLRWINTTGEQAVADDPEFFKKVFCINTSEFNWYPKGADYTSVNRVPDYSR